jgi:ATP-dependent Clp protease ATP-binding subunit ClpC
MNDPSLSVWRYSDRARLVFALARQYAFDQRSRSVSPEHILRGLACAGTGRALEVLGGLGVDLIQLYPQVLELFPPEAIRSPGLQVPDEWRSSTPLEIQLGPEVEEGLRAAKRFAAKMAYNYLGTEHLILGLLGCDSPAAAFLREKGLSFEAVKNGIAPLV